MSIFCRKKRQNSWAKKYSRLITSDLFVTCPRFIVFSLMGIFIVKKNNHKNKQTNSNNNKNAYFIIKGWPGICFIDLCCQTWQWWGSGPSPAAVPDTTGAKYSSHFKRLDATMKVRNDVNREHVLESYSHTAVQHEGQKQPYPCANQTNLTSSVVGC